MVRAKWVRISLSNHGDYLGFRGNEFFVKDQARNEVTTYDLTDPQVGEITLGNGNLVSTSALTVALEQKINVVITGFCGNPIGILKALDDDSHVQTRIMQYEAYKTSKAIDIAKTFVLAKLEGQQQLLAKHGLEPHDLDRAKRMIDAIRSDDLAYVRRHLIHIEGQFTQEYYRRIFSLLPEKFRITRRKTHRAFDGTNNLFNLGYTILFWKIYQALAKAKLEPYLGFLHTLERERPSLVCDFQELYRYLIDDFIIQYARNLKKNDFRTYREKLTTRKFGSGRIKRQFLKPSTNSEFARSLHRYFTWHVRIPRIKRGFRQKLETLINEETILFACYLRGERETWIPRIATPLITR